MDQRLRLETPEWRVLDFTENTEPDEEVERQRARFMRTPLVRGDPEYPFSEDLIKEYACFVDSDLPFLANVSYSVEVLRLGGSFELVEELWSKFFLTASCVNIGVCRSRIGVLVSIRIVSVS